MNNHEFLQEFDESHFPRRLGPELDMQSHDPPFMKCELRKFAKNGLIVLDDENWTYRLTLAATDALHNVEVRGSRSAKRGGNPNA